MAISHIFTNNIADGTNTAIVRPSDWNSAHNQYLTITGNTLGNTTLSGTNIVWGATQNVSLSRVNATRVDVVGPDLTPYLTTAALSNHSHGNPTLALTNISGTTASNSAGLTLSLSGNDVTQFLTTAALSNHSHGNPTLALTNLSGTTASNSAGLTLSLSAGAAGNGNTLSYFANVSGMNVNFGNPPYLSNSHAIAPFVLPCAVSADFMRLACAMSTNSTTRATSAETTISMQRATTMAAVVYKQGAGANSLSLQSVASMSVLSAMAFSLSANVNGSEYTVSQSITYPAGSGNTSFYSTTYASTQTHFAIHTSHLTAFTATRLVDVPYSSSLAQSNYWLGLNGSFDFTTVQNAAWSNWNCAIGTILGVSASNQAVGFPGQATNSSLQLNGPGAGSFTTNVQGTTASIALANISSIANHPVARFELMRFA